MSSNLIGALRGPLLLVTLGILNWISLHPPQVSFRYTWPVLIIVYGVMKLAEALVSRDATPLGGSAV